MSATTFAELRDQLYSLYFSEKFAEAYELVSRAEPQLPEHVERVMYWRACLACRTGDITQAIAVLREMLAKGYWYSPEFLLRDDDLKPLHSNPAFDDMLTASRAQFEAAQAQSRPQRRVLETPNAEPPYPLLLAMHGNNGSLAATTQWGYAHDHGYLVALAQSSQVIAANTYNWDDWQRATGEIQQHLAELQGEYPIDVARIIPGGFSMSGGLVAWLTLTGAIEAPGFVSVGPYVPDMQCFLDLFAAGGQRPVRGFIVVGEQDTQCLAAAQQIRDLMLANSLACELEIVPGLGHDFPADWEARLERGLEFVTR